jgi:hypothetical protein
MKLNPRLPCHRQHSKGRKLFTSKLALILWRKLVNCYIWSRALYSAETWTLRKVDGNTRKLLKCGAGEGWR